MNQYCICYSYMETPESKKHLEFFLKNGVLNNSNVFYIFVIVNHVYSVQFPIQSNIKIITRENVGYDFSSWKVGLDSIDINSFDRFIFMNDTVCGPFIPRYIPKNITWFSMFCSLLSDKVKLSGLTINHYPWGKNDSSLTHVQSMMFCTDKIGINILNKEIFHLSPAEAQQIFNKNKKEYIKKFEIGMSQTIIRHGYKIDGLCVCNINKKYKTGDIWYNNKYFNTTINPFETLFIKKNRIQSSIINLYSELLTK